MNVVVVGAGVAGLASALSAREAADVTVVGPSSGASGLAGGAWDVVPLSIGSGAFGGEQPTLADAIRRFADKHPRHPYACLPGDPVEHVATAHRVVLPALGGYRPLDLDGPGLAISTELGIVRRVATAQQQILRLDEMQDAVIAVAGLVGYRRFDADFLARAIAEQADAGGAALHVAAIELEFFRRRSDALLHPHEVAHIVERDDGLKRLTVTVVRAIAGLGFDAVVLPPLLGIVDGVADRLRDGVGVPVGELTVCLSGPQGMRLERATQRALEEAGCTLRRDRVRRLVKRASTWVVELDDGEELEADTVVLATGGLVGGGLVAEGRVVREPLFDLDVTAGGVAHDGELRAVDARGRSVDGLFVAGGLLAGLDEGDGTGLGACATTGYLAGVAAVG